MHNRRQEWAGMTSCGYSMCSTRLLFGLCLNEMEGDLLQTSDAFLILSTTKQLSEMIRVISALALGCGEGGTVFISDARPA